MKTLKILAALLSYPSADLMAAIPECREVLAQEKWVSDANIKALNHLMNWMAGEDLLDLQEEYVQLFDRTPSLCLHLFEHVHGDSRDRGQALVDLMEIYKDAGLMINTDEIPDFLPLFLEYLSVISPEEASDNIGDTINVLAAIGGRLKNRQSPYAAIFEALEHMASAQPDKAAVEASLIDASGAAQTFDEIDELWEEQMAFENSTQTTSGAGDGCPQAKEMLARMNLPHDVDLKVKDIKETSQ